MLGFMQVVVLALGLCCANILLARNCDNINWRQLGMKEAQEGKSLDVLRKYKNKCKPKLKKNDIGDYLSGYEAGLHRYCTRDNGFALGSQGVGYNDICPDEIEGEFLVGYDKGYANYSREKISKDVADKNRRKNMEDLQRRKEMSRKSPR